MMGSLLHLQGHLVKGRAGLEPGDLALVHRVVDHQLELGGIRAGDDQLQRLMRKTRRDFQNVLGESETKGEQTLPGASSLRPTMEMVSLGEILS